MEHRGTKTIETEHLQLRRFDVSDAADMHRNWASDAEVTKFLRWETHADLAETQSVLNRWTEEYSQADAYRWAVTLKDSGEVIGSLGVFAISELDLTAEIGYCIGRAFWGKGYTTEAVEAVIEYMFYSIGLNRIEAYHSVQNPASGKVMLKAGMTREGFSKQKYRCRMGFQDCELYGIVKSELLAKELELVLPREDLREQYAELLADWQQSGEKIVPYALTFSKDSFAEMLQTAQDFREGRQRIGYVPSTVYWLLRKSDGKFLGAIDIRHELNDYLRHIGGNIGYGIRPSERRKGYAGKMLFLALEKCRALGLTEALITCDTENTGSARTIQKNGGVLIGEDVEEGVPFQRYSIKL